jgi:prevent-host-death family protein
MEWNREQLDNKSKILSVAEAKSRFSEYVSKVAYAGHRYVITKRGKPLVALVSIEDLENIQTRGDTEKISDIVGKWENFDEIEKDIAKSYDSRKEDRGRDVSF